MHIDIIESLRQLYSAPQERAIKKLIAVLDEHCRRFIQLSPFLVLATGDDAHNLDASPRGGARGFVKVTVEGALLIPDAPGNNRLDSLENILSTRRVGLIFLIPGFNETLRVNETATLSTAKQDIDLCTDERRAPELVVKVTVEAAYLHCAKAFVRSRLWSLEAKLDRATLPTAAKMISDQTGIVVAPETQTEMEKRYAPDL